MVYFLMWKLSLVDRGRETDSMSMSTQLGQAALFGAGLLVSVIPMPSVAEMNIPFLVRWSRGNIE